MIISGLVSLVTTAIISAFSGFEALSIPTSLIYVLSEILRYGIYIIGADVMAFVITSITFWWGLKFSVGLVIFIWELLPLT